MIDVVMIAVFFVLGWFLAEALRRRTKSKPMGVVLLRGERVCTFTSIAVRIGDGDTRAIYIVSGCRFVAEYAYGMAEPEYQIVPDPFGEQSVDFDDLKLVGISKVKSEVTSVTLESETAHVELHT